mmetsp:Transcript_59002/g.183183  ORF Transcript_59002/g.183183 Transcript_59002/m.183183 type:complete len:403 (+) Transcript_59002:31-1239(+)
MWPLLRQLAVFVSAVRGLEDTWTLVRLREAAHSAGAVCLDGSPGAYYIRKPLEATGDSKWLIFNEGGGWCLTDENCYERSLTDLGSSDAYPETFGPHEAQDLFDAFPAFSVVYVKYCDGGSMTGNRQEAILVSGRPVYYRGRRLLDAVLDHLLANGLAGASQLLYAGCSAGATTTYQNIDYVRGRMSADAKVLGLTDAMFTLHLDRDFAGQENYYTRQFVWGYKAWNSSAGVNKACSQLLGDDAWRCFHGATVAQFVETPLLIVNSKFDTWQAGAVLGLNATECPGSVEVDGKVMLCDNSTEASRSEWSFWSGYGDRMVAALTSSVPRRHGAFLTNCPVHCMTSGGPWRDPTFPGTRLNAAVLQWYDWALDNYGNASWPAPRWLAGHVYEHGCVQLERVLLT